jgi:NAD(P)-dependent dehydrogenase (short-subunit alcohol dehydrogenase family)
MTARSILITGVSSGIGAATAEHFLARGWRVLGTVRRLEDAAQLTERGGKQFSPILLDVTDQVRISQLPAEVEALLEGAPLDVLCNNAGTSMPAAAVYQSVAGFRSAIELNLIAPFAITRALFPLLRRPGGRIVFIGSLAGVEPLPFCGAYSAAKHGIEGLAGSLRVELGQHGIHTSVIAPGSVRTAIGSKLGPDTPIEGADSEFGPAFGRMAKHMGKEAQTALDPLRVAQAVELACNTREPRARYVVTPGYVSNWLAPRLLGRKWLESRWRRRLFGKD